MTEDTAARRLAKIIGRLDGMAVDMKNDMDSVRHLLVSLEPLIADEEQAVTNLSLRAQLRAEQAWSKRLADATRAWAARLEQHSNDLEHRLMERGVNDPALMDIADRLDALRHDMEEGT